MVIVRRVSGVVAGVVLAVTVVLVAAPEAQRRDAQHWVATWGIPMGAAVIVGAWALTAAYVIWANRVYDPEAERLRRLADRR